MHGYGRGRHHMRVPEPCPECGGHMEYAQYYATLRILKVRGWHICLECGYERNIDDFKSMLFRK